MNLQESIRRILREERDLSNSITKLLNKLVVSKYEDVCKVEVIPPWNRESLSGDHNYRDYKIIVYFLGGYGTKNWPRTMAVRDKEEEIMNIIWQHTYSVFNTPVDIYSKLISNCE